MSYLCIGKSFLSKKHSSQWTSCELMEKHEHVKLGYPFGSLSSILKLKIILRYAKMTIML